MSVPSQREVVNSARPGREQRQRRNRVPGCGWHELPPILLVSLTFQKFVQTRSALLPYSAYEL